MRLYIDVEGMFSLNKKIAELFDINYNNKRIQEEFCQDYDGLSSFIGEDLIGKKIVEKGGAFWSRLPLMPWAKELYESMEKTVGVHDIYFVSSVPPIFPKSASYIAEALHKNFTTGPEKLICIKEKFLLASSHAFLLDVKQENVDLFKRSGASAITLPNEFKCLLELVDQTDILATITRKVKTVKNTYG